MIITQESPYNVDAIHLLVMSVEFIRSLYPEEHAHTFKLIELSSNRARFFMARHEDRAIGCAAYIWHGDQVEIKHMYVSPVSRGLGCGRALMRTVEHYATMDHAVRIILETSNKQVAAIRLYEAFGYLACDPYTDHHADDIFMAKFV